MAYREDLDMGKITLISLVSVLVMVALLLFLQVLYYGFLRRQLASSKYTQSDATLSKYVADQQGDLMSIRVVDRDRQVATIPIEAAMELVVGQLKSDPAASVTGVADPVEVPAEQSDTGPANGDGEDEQESVVPDDSALRDGVTPDKVPEKQPSDNALSEDDLELPDTIDNDLEPGDPPPIEGDGSETDAKEEPGGEGSGSEAEGGTPSAGGDEAEEDSTSDDP